ncbi:MAG: sugar phosphate isomerase/epimerase [Candidatus Heimdallarchaeota archaeon]|nr:sugar phosphate isomerase/epimerase [Candidatus Heimdallarchaeota archaeon]
MQFGASYVLDKLQIADLVTTKKIGFDFAEFYLGDFWNDMKELELQLIAVREILDSYDLFSIIHLSHLNSQFIKDSEQWTSYIDNLSEQINLIGHLGITNKIVFHGTFGKTEDPSGMSSDEVFNKKIDAITEWTNIAQQYKMKMLLENTDESITDLRVVFKKLPNLGFTFDIGHANIIFPHLKVKNSEENIYEMLKNFKNQLEHIHIHDNFSGISESSDRHLPIGTGNINFLKFFSYLKDIKYGESITLEIYNPNFLSIYLEASYKTIQEILQQDADQNKFSYI